jgi:parallel beta-helix repeat protein
MAIEDFSASFIFEPRHTKLGERMNLSRKTVSAIILTMLIISTLTLTFNIQPVKAGGEELGKPIADFLWYPISPIVGDVVTCNSTSAPNDTAPIVAWLWEIDGPATGVTLMDSPVMAFQADGVGEVTVALTVWNTLGMSGTTVKSIVVFEGTSSRTLTIIPHVGGTTDPLPGAYYYDLGEEVLVTAAANLGYVFDHWILDDYHTDESTNPYSITMDTDHVLEAVFEMTTNPPPPPPDPTPIGIVYIREDGSVYPPWAPIQRNGDLYTFTNSMHSSVFDESSIFVEKSNIVIDGNGYTLEGSGSGFGFSFYHTSNVTVRNTNIRNFHYGVFLDRSSNNIVSGNNITNNWHGVSVYYWSNNNSVSGNRISSNSTGVGLDYSCCDNSVSGNIINSPRGYGVRLDYVSNNSVSENRIWAFAGYGVYIIASSNNSVSGNNITSINGYGVYLRSSSNNTISGNNLKPLPDVTSNYGVYLRSSSNNTISGNNIANNYNGVYLYDSCFNNIVSGNNITANSHNGVDLYSSSENTVSGNNITANNAYGVIFVSSSNNRIFHNNFMDNGQEVYSRDSENVWDDGYPSGGNFWSDYMGQDQNEDGIGDTPYIINADNQDRYPLMNPWRWTPQLPPPPTPTPPVASFNYHPTNPLIGEEITFDAFASYDPDGGTIANYRWEFYRLTEYVPFPLIGIIEGADKETVYYSFSSKGAYLVNLTVTDDEGATNSIDKTVKVWDTWTFAIINDLHIGRGYPDYGGKGIETEDMQVEGQDYYLTERLQRTVEWIIDNRDNYNIRFVVVLGDISDSGEYSELKKAKNILDKLNEEDIPYVPVIGNHDIWPYTDKEEKSSYSDYFKRIFQDRFAVLAHDPNFNLQFQESQKELINYRFTYKRVNFVALDFNSRTHVPLGQGVMPFAALHEETLDWLNDSLALYEEEPVVLLSHHPFVFDLTMAFQIGELDDIDNAIEDSNAEVIANFAGHIHGFYDEYHRLGFRPPINPHFMDANKDYTGAWFTPDIPILTTEALMVASNEPAPKGIIRLVEVKGEEIDDYDTIEGEFLALNPYFKPTASVLFKDTLYQEFKAYAFTKIFTDQFPLSYTLHFGDGSSQTVLSTSGEPVKFWHYYDAWRPDNAYDVTLTVQGYAPDGTGLIEEEITKTMTFGVSWLSVIAHSPVDIVVTDPEGLTISKQLNEIPDATYIEININGDGDPDDIIVIPNRKIGDYLITVVPEPDVAPTDTYTLEVWINGITTVLAENAQISNIPTQSYIIRSTETEIIPIIPATVDFDPDALNLKSKGQWVTVYIELPVGHGYDVSMINLTSVMLNDQVQAEIKPIAIGDYDGDGIPDLMVKFNRTAVQSILNVGDDVEITISGTLIDGRLFEDKDTIQVILPP